MRKDWSALARDNRAAGFTGQVGNAELCEIRRGGECRLLRPFEMRRRAEPHVMYRGHARGLGSWADVSVATRLCSSTGSSRARPLARHRLVAYLEVPLQTVPWVKSVITLPDSLPCLAKLPVMITNPWCWWVGEK